MMEWGKGREMTGVVNLKKKSLSCCGFDTSYNLYALLQYFRLGWIFGLTPPPRLPTLFIWFFGSARIKLLNDGSLFPGSGEIK